MLGQAVAVLANRLEISLARTKMGTKLVVKFHVPADVKCHGEFHSHQPIFQPMENCGTTNHLFSVVKVFDVLQGNGVSGLC